MTNRFYDEDLLIDDSKYIEETRRIRQMSDEEFKEYLEELKKEEQERD